MTTPLAKNIKSKTCTLVCGSADKFFDATTVDKLNGEIKGSSACMITGQNKGSGTHFQIAQICEKNDYHLISVAPIHGSDGVCADMIVDTKKYGKNHSMYALGTNGFERQKIMAGTAGANGAELWTLEGGPGTMNEVIAFVEAAGVEKWTKAINSHYLISLLEESHPALAEHAQTILR
jgi:hypothetical protein